MFSRRVPEALASGVTVLSVPSKSIKTHFSNNVYFSTDRKTTENTINKVLYADNRLEIAYDGVRETLLYNTYYHRLRQICKILKIPAPRRREGVVLVVIQSPEDEFNKFIEGQIRAQTYAHILGTLYIDLKNPEHTFDALYDLFIQRTLPYQETTCDELGFVAILYPGNLYEKNYITDLVLAACYTQSVDIIGKSCIYRQTLSGEPEILFEETEHRYDQELHPQTLLFSLAGDATDRKHRMNYLLQSFGFDTVQGKEMTTYSVDRYNFLYMPELSTLVDEDER
jgi:hypothetical protein